jgi:isopentenyl diphosphate isomerase/L-lactate dehydrogenase-like FMN-dependent dehydrogenase
MEAYNISDLRLVARRRLPKGIFEFVDRGTEDDVALRANRRAFDLVSLMPRVLVDVSKRNLATEVFGRRVAAPIAVAPTGAAGLLWYEGEIAVARAAAANGLPFTLSTASITSMEKVAARAGGRLWFQLYMWPDRALSHELIRRAAGAGYEALIVTVDTAVTPNREYNRRNGFAFPFRFNRRNVVDIALHPQWALGVMGRYLMASGRPQFENYPEEMRRSLTKAPGRGLPKNDSVTWEDLKQLRDMWRGPLVVKGILHPDDAAAAAACGADGVIVSNHGGRNLDASMAPLRALPEVAARVGDRLTVMIDGAFTRGSDVVKALALGAKLVLAGRAPLWGVAASGEPGASLALKLLKEEMDRVLAFVGCPDVASLDAGLLRVEPGFLAEDVRLAMPAPRPEAGSGSSGPVRLATTAAG